MAESSEPVGVDIPEEICDILDELLERIEVQTNKGDHNFEGADDEQLIRICTEVAVENSQPDKVPGVLGLLYGCLYDVYKSGAGNPILLKTAVACCRAALRLSPPVEDRIVHLYRHGDMLKDLIDFTPDQKYLDEAVDSARELLVISENWPYNGQTHQEQRDMHLVALHDYVAALDRRYSERNDAADLDRALQLGLEALNLAGDTFANRRAMLLNTVSQLYERRFEKARRAADVDEAIRMGQETISLIPPASSDRAIALSNLSRRFHIRYRYKDSVSDIDKAVETAREAVSLGQTKPSVRAVCLSSLSASLSSRYKRTRETDDINEAISTADEALRLQTNSNPTDKASSLNDLAAAYYCRYVVKEELSDVNEAIERARQAVALSPEGSAMKLDSLQILQLALSKMVSRTREKKDRDAAAQVVRKVLSSSRDGEKTTRAFGLIGLSWLLQHQYDDTGNKSDLDEAVEAAREAVGLTPQDDPFYAAAARSLAGRLIRRHEAADAEADLQSAVRCLRQARTLILEDDDDILSLLYDLAAALERTGKKDDRNEAIALFRDASRNPCGLPLNRIECARGAIATLINLGGEAGWAEARTLAEEALKLVPLLCRRYMSRQDQLWAMTQVSGLVAQAASLSIHAGDAKKAVQQLEFGRGLILGYSIDDDSDLSRLQRDNEDLARRYESLRLKVDEEQLEDYRTAALPETLTNEDTTGAPEQLIAEWRQQIARKLAKERRENLDKMETIVEEIRRVKGYERFLTPPDISELKSLAAEGPIVIVNFSEIRADAIIITLKEMKALKLDLKLEEAPLVIKEKFRAYRSISGRHGNNRDIALVDDDDLADDDPRSNQYSWLWRSCVKPVLDELEKMGFVSSASGQRPRVWWIGSGMASSLPFHAAGVDFSSTSSENTLGRIAPSYTPTIKALAHSRLRAFKSIGDPPRDNNDIGSVLLVTMPTTCGYKDLPGVDEERDAVKRACNGFFDVEELRLPTAEDVLRKLDQSSIVHFACHGASDPRNPYGSHLLLQKRGNKDGKMALDKLTVSAISKVTTASNRPRWIAFLSACSTAEIKATRLADEGLHLASAFQLCGFPHVIGALRPVNDKACTRIAEKFYDELTKCGTAGRRDAQGAAIIAVAFWRVVIQLRAESGDDSSLWAPFAHFGI
jgi:hypothetical protein